MAAFIRRVDVHIDRTQIDDLETPLESETEIRLVLAVAGGVL